MSLSRHRPEFALLVAVVLLWACGSSPRVPSSTQVSGPSSSPPSPAGTATPTAVSPAAPVPYSGPNLPLLDRVVVTVSDRLRVRSEPRVSDDSIMYEPVLPIGTELTVLDGPVSSSGYTWYKVAPVSFSGLDGPGYGWVALAGIDGEPWIALPEAPIALAQATPQGALAWQRVPTATAIAGGGSRGLKLQSLSTVSGGLLALGGDVRGAVVLRSPDGVQWTRARDEAAFDSASVRAVATQGGSIVAVGARSGSARGLLWTTTDGLAWREGGYAFDGNIEVVGVAAGVASFVVAGSFRTPPDSSGFRRLAGAAWTSKDGRRWDRMVMPLEADAGDYQLIYITFAGSRFVALGRASDNDADTPMLVWTSTDGREWARGQDIPVGHLSDVVVAPTGALLAVGWTTDTPSRAAAFTSPDGIRWTPVPDQPAFEGAAMHGLACDERHCLAVGESVGASPSNAAAWTTADGVTWSRTGPMVGLGDAGMRDVALTGQGAVAIGWAASVFEGTPYTDNASFWITPSVALPAAVPPRAVQSIAGHWETLPSMSTARIYPAVAVGKDGRIYIFGGKTRPAGTSTTIQASSVEIFDPVTDTWSSGTPIPGPGRIRLAAVTAADGRIFLFHSSSRQVLVYDPARSAWTTGPSIPSGTHVYGAVAGPGRLLSVVLENAVTPARSSLWLYSLDPVTARWRSRGATSGIPVASGADGLLYGVTGFRAWTIDPATGQTSSRSATPEFAAFLSGAPGPGGLIWAVGAAYLHPSGLRSAQWSRPVVEAYDPATDSWRVAPLPAVLRWWHAVVGSGDRVYVIGGSTGTYTNTVEVFVPD